MRLVSSFRSAAEGLNRTERGAGRRRPLGPMGAPVTGRPVSVLMLVVTPVRRPKRARTTRAPGGECRANMVPSRVEEALWALFVRWVCQLPDVVAGALVVAA